MSCWPTSHGRSRTTLSVTGRVRRVLGKPTRLLWLPSTERMELTGGSTHPDPRQGGRRPGRATPGPRRRRRGRRVHQHLAGSDGHAPGRAGDRVHRPRRPDQRPAERAQHGPRPDARPGGAGRARGARHRCVAAAHQRGPRCPAPADQRPGRPAPRGLGQRPLDARRPACGARRGRRRRRQPGSRQPRGGPRGVRGLHRDGGDHLRLARPVRAGGRRRRPASG